MTKYYTDEKQAQILIALLKAHGIKRVIASPGTTNMAFVGSIQNDPWFQIYSSVDERSAAYMACGMSSETGEPVVLSCTGATASRNYMSGLTEAYYRKLPILSVTSHQGIHKVGHNIPQVIDRSVMPNDTVKLSVNLPAVKDKDDLWDCEIKVNQAILELKRQGGGPVHINLSTGYSSNYHVKELPKYRCIKRITTNDEFPLLPDGKIAVFVGAHICFAKVEASQIDAFCEKYNAVVFCDHTSNYKGRYRVLGSVLACQEKLYLKEMHIDTLIHIGEVSGDYFSFLTLRAKQVWRISEDGELRDLFRCLQYVFEMPEINFFEYYTNCNETKLLNEGINKCALDMYIKDIQDKLPVLPFSNIWIASRLTPVLPEKSTIHFAILNSLRTWNLFEMPISVKASSNVGGFGIDGCMSSLVGASLANKDKLFYGVVGDLAFFYDMNVLGNRHVGNNLRILLVNNGKGQEFKNFNHPASLMGEKADNYIAAGGHFGKKSKDLVKHYAVDLGFEYLFASNKQEFEKTYNKFISAEITDSPMLFEIFTNEEDESEALKIITQVAETITGKAKEVTKRILGKKNISTLKKIIKK